MRFPDAATWASTVAERLPPTDVVKLAYAAANGTQAVDELRAQSGAAILRDFCDQLLEQLSANDPVYLAGLLTGAAWTGPESGISTSRLTAATVIDLIAEARRELLLVSFATQTEPGISAALAAASGRGVSIMLLTERHTDNHSYSNAATPFPDLTAIRLHWPAAERPHGAALHAKIIVVDDHVALVGSANLTGRAMEDNLECGILIRGGKQPRAIREHVMSLYMAGRLRRL